jgi:DNA (cytosine-5)-methyltransferase 1
LEENNLSGGAEERPLEVVEICAGAGGQTLGLERAGFRHRLALELDENAARTLRHNLVRVLGYDEKEAKDTVRIGDVADPKTWKKPGGDSGPGEGAELLEDWGLSEYEGVDLLAGGVPCPPFSIAGKQLGASDERDLFAWAVELCGKMRPKALLLENVKGLSGNRFTAYRKHVLDRLQEFDYEAEWRLLQADQFGVSQLRPRFVLVALQQEYARHFHWPTPSSEPPPTVGELLRDLMAEGDWTAKRLEAWVEQANDIAPTIVGGSKKHGGADLGPTRAKAAWAALGVDAKGVADDPPGPTNPRVKGAKHPMLTVEMVARIQGWYGEDFAEWEFLGGKTSRYRQIGNAFPPPVAKALGVAIKKAILKTAAERPVVKTSEMTLDPVYRILRGSKRAVTVEQLVSQLAENGVALERPEVERRISHLSHDFELIEKPRKNGEVAFLLGGFKAFIGQDDHQRHQLFAQHRTKIS